LPNIENGATIKLWEFKTDEFESFKKAVIADDRSAGTVDLNMTSTEDQGVGFMWEQHIDWRDIQSGSVVLSLQAATEEWGEATAVDAKFFIELEDGVLPNRRYTEAYPRYYKAAGTSAREITFTKGVMVGGYRTLSAGYQADGYLRVSEGKIVKTWKKWYEFMADHVRVTKSTGATETNDLPIDGRFPAMAVPAHPERKLSITPSESAALTFWPHLVFRATA
jgi:hypothetical protein